MTTIGGVVLLQLLSCGGDDGPTCPTDDCSVPGSTVVKFKFNHYPELGFDSDTCLDVEATHVLVEVVHTADPAIFDAKQPECGNGQASFLRLPDGTYDVSVTPLDVDGSPLVRAATKGQVVAGVPGALPSEVTINVPYPMWTRSYLGTFLFRLAWAGMSCETATPPIATQTLTLTAGGSIVTQQTSDSGQQMDGTDPRPCRPLTEQFAQFVPMATEMMLPWGPAKLHVVGRDTGGTVRFDREFDTFVGAAKNNPTLTFDSPPPDAMPDAPVDAPPDAAIDAPVD